MVGKRSRNVSRDLALLGSVSGGATADGSELTSIVSGLFVVVAGEARVLFLALSSVLVAVAFLGLS